MKKLVVIAVLFTAIVTGAFAQAGEITDYMFGLPGGNYMEVQWYPYAGFEKFYVQAGLSTGKADLGFAAKNSKIYFGVSYAGNIFHQYNWSYTEEGTFFPGPASGTDTTLATSPNNKKIKSYTTPANFASPSVAGGYTRPVDHNIGILIGVANMGFKIGFSSDYQIFEVKEDVRVDYVNYKSYKIEYGNLTPSVKWGMAKDLIENKGIRPAVELSFGFHVDQREVEEYETVTVGGVNTYPIKGRDKKITAANGSDGTDNYTVFGLKINLGGFTIVSQDNGFSFSVDLDYSLESKIYGDNQVAYLYNAPGTTYNTYRYFKEKGRNYDSTDSTYETDIVNGNHKIEPTLQVQWSSDKVGLGAKLHLPVTIDSDEYTTNTIVSGTNNFYTGLPASGASSYKFRKDSSVKEVTVGFAPELKLGGQYKLVPDKLNINMGATIGLSKAESTTTETTTIDYAGSTVTTGWIKRNETTKTEVVPASNPTSSSFSVGATLFLTKNVILDAWTGVKDATYFNLFGDNSGTPSLTYFGGILLMLSF